MGRVDVEGEAGCVGVGKATNTTEKQKCELRLQNGDILATPYNFKGSG